MEIIYKHFNTLSSTNDWGKIHLPTCPRNAMTVISADEQSAGRGRYGKRWFSPPGENLYASFCFFTKEDLYPNNLKNLDFGCAKANFSGCLSTTCLSLTQLLAASAAHCLEEYAVHCQIKWPNDLLVNGKKIAGILCETQVLPPYLGVVIGIGLNINMSQDHDVGQPATSLIVETESIHSPQVVLKQLAAHFVTNLPGIKQAKKFISGPCHT